MAANEVGVFIDEEKRIDAAKSRPSQCLDNSIPYTHTPARLLSLGLLFQPTPWTWPFVGGLSRGKRSLMVLGRLSWKGRRRLIFVEL